jgi:hypothetical protein
MVLLFAAALAPFTAPPPSLPPPWAHQHVAPTVQARASVRIVSGATLWLGRANPVAGQRLRFTRVETADGLHPARLVEFE